MIRRALSSMMFIAPWLVLGCGGSAPVVAKADEASEREAQRTIASTPTMEARPARADDLALRALGESPIGPIDAEAAATYGIELEVRNQSSNAITIGPASVHVSVYRRSLVIEGCRTPAPREIDLSAPIAGGASTVVTVPLPCAITEPGSYDVVLVLLTEHPVVLGLGTTLDARTSATMPLVVDGSLPPFRAR